MSATDICVFSFVNFKSLIWTQIKRVLYNIHDTRPRLNIEFLLSKTFSFWILPNYVNVGHRVKRNRLIFCPYFCVLSIASSSPKSLGSEWGWNSSTFLPWIQTFLDHKYIFDHPCIVFCTDAFRTWSLQGDEKYVQCELQTFFQHDHSVIWRVF